MDPFLAAAHKAIAALEESIEFNAVPDWSPSIERRREAIRALQRVLQSGWVPEGWCLVPIQPTRAMHLAHDDTWRSVDRCWAPLPDVTKKAWREMLRAAPVPLPPQRADRVAGGSVAAPSAQTDALRSPQAQLIVRRVQVSLGRLG